MTFRLLCLGGTLATCFLASCADSSGDSFAFLGILESESSNQGPVGLINGEPCQIKNVTAVSETTISQYALSKEAGDIFVEETHGDYIYYAIQQQRDVRFDNVSAWVEVIERFKVRRE